jgi:hypothetical protein
MTSEDLRAELERDPFMPVDLHLVSGKTVRVAYPGDAVLLQNAVMVIRGKQPGKVSAEGYDIIALRNIERIESDGSPARNGVH